MSAGAKTSDPVLELEYASDSDEYESDTDSSDDEEHIQQLQAVADHNWVFSTYEQRAIILADEEDESKLHTDEEIEEIYAKNIELIERVPFTPCICGEVYSPDVYMSIDEETEQWDRWQAIIENTTDAELAQMESEKWFDRIGQTILDKRDY